MRSVRWTRRRWILAVLTTAVLLVAGFVLHETEPEKDFRRAVNHLTSLLDEGGSAIPASMTVEVVKADGLPKYLADLQFQMAIAAPEHLWISGQVGKESVQIGRKGQQLWVWQPAKSFGVRGEPGVPRFSTAPETSLDNAKLGPLALPANRGLISFASRIVPVKAVGDEMIGEERCRVLEVAAGSMTFGRSKAVLRMWVREKDGWPVRIAVADGGKLDAVVSLREIQPGVPLPDSQWEMPAEASPHVERVALSHLQKMLGAALKIAKTDLPTLGPADGSRTLVAEHGKGRLEMHDGTRVLFLRGTPEEMGEQHGTLLRSEVRDLVERVVYGVGVGSSFGKGRWFFGEIEECQARIAPFIDPRYLREMDAMAAAAGLEKQEMRLANFFPELFHCSGFAVMGEATAGGRIYHGRILDYMKGIGLEANAVVTVNQPDQGYAWVNVGYAGFIGSVTGMNEKQISIGEMGGKGEGNWDGKPMAQLVREVMEKAGTLEEAIEIMGVGPRTCEYFYVIADGKTGTAAGIA
ncbi:MAG: C45 family autoproteolytic acyltransferase/hydrolase, partial [Chthoniobacteraceae bacterium]